MEAEEYLKIALGGNMNISTLTPLAWHDIMDSYATIKVQESKEETRQWLIDEDFEGLAERL